MGLLPKFSMASAFVSPPVIWGKVPSHSDYLQHRGHAGESRAWQDWFMQQTRGGVVSAGVSEQQASLGLYGLLADPVQTASARPRATTLPIAFVLPPKTLSFAPQRYILGVVIHSRDRIGREHPLLVYQQANVQWVKHSLEAQAAATGQDWLFWLSRLVTCYVAKPLGTERPTLPESVDALWGHYAPSWLHRWGRKQHLPSKESILQILARASLGEGVPDSAGKLSGVQSLPWADWPHRVWQGSGRSAFWQQDSTGRYVGATQNLNDVWGRA